MRYLFMNTIQAQTNASPANGSGAQDVLKNTTKISVLPVVNAQTNVDHYSATGEAGSVVARVLTSSISKNFSSSAGNDLSAQAVSKLQERFSASAQNDEVLPSIQTVTSNVVGFVENALANLAKRGFDEEQLNFFRNEAVKGVEVGIDQAKLDLIGLVDDDTFQLISDTKDSIMKGILKLAIDPQDYSQQVNNIEQVENGVQRALSAISIKTFANDPVKIDFETRAFNSAQVDENKSMHTTSSSNISFAIEGMVSDAEHLSVAILLNKIDGLANSFYRGDIESAYNKSIALGYTDNEISGLAKQLNKSDKFQQMKMYEDIEHLTGVTNNADFAAPKAVAEYVNKYLDVMESSQSALHSETDFNQVINGLVNQMKDVQVPDLLQAINRFHAFNKKFS